MGKPETDDKQGPRRIEIETPEDEQPTETAAAEESLETPAPESAPEAAAEGEAEVVEAEAQALEEELAKLRETLAELEQKCAEAENQHLRAVADLQNFRRRAQQEKEQLKKFAIEGLVEEVLHVLDNFERAMQVKVDSPGAESLMMGVQMIYDQVQQLLAGHGVAKVESVGQEFDPHQHEAIEKEESSEVAPNVVIAELTRGYTLHGRLVRPARVRVSVAPPESAAGEGGNEGTEES